MRFRQGRRRAPAARDGAGRCSGGRREACELPFPRVFLGHGEGSLRYERVQGVALRGPSRACRSSAKSDSSLEAKGGQKLLPRTAFRERLSAGCGGVRACWSHPYPWEVGWRPIDRIRIDPTLVVSVQWDRAFIQCDRLLERRFVVALASDPDQRSGRKVEGEVELRERLDCGVACGGRVDSRRHSTERPADWASTAGDPPTRVPRRGSFSPRSLRKRPFC